MIAAGDTAAAARTAIGAAEATALQDTGWRDVVTLLEAAWQVDGGAGFARMRRVGDQVEIALRIKATTTAPLKIMEIPDGFHPAFRWFRYGIFDAGKTFGGVQEIGQLNSATELSVLSFDVLEGGQCWTTVRYSTNQPFPLPAAYPGTPA